MTGIMFTAAQHTAIFTHDRPLIVTAGAGSGKTFVLVNRFIALLEANPALPVNAIAAITFTEKAAAEMRERVRSAVKARATTSGEQAERWRKRLDAIDGARIGTIHALCAALLRSSAAEAGLAPDFEVLDEVASRLLLRDAIDDALRAPHAAEATAALMDAYDGASVHKALAALVLAEAPPQEPAALIDAWRTAWLADVAAAFADLPSALAASGFDDLPLASVPANDKLGALWREVAAMLAHVRAPLAADEDSAAAWVALCQQAADAIKLNVGAAAAWGGKDSLAEAKAMLKAVREALQAAATAAGAPPGPLDDEAASLVGAWAQVATTAAGRYRALKGARHALDFDDLEREADRLLNDPAARERIAAEIHHVLVDEFQDTNARQYRIVQALAHTGRPGALFVVGDPKQSIYGFRGADVRGFTNVADGIRAGGGAEAALADSFRTHSALVARFNGLFALLLTADSPYAIAFGEPMAASRPAPSDDPPLALLLLAKPEKSDDDDDDGPDKHAREATAIAEQLTALVRQQRPIYDRAQMRVRPVQYGDMAILFQAMTHASAVEDALAQAGIPYVTAAGKGFYDLQEVWDALNLLRALYNPADDLALAAALRSPMFAFSDEALLHLRLHDPAHGGGWLWSALHEASLAAFDTDDADALQFARASLASLRQLAGRVRLGALLRRAYALTGYLAVLDALPAGARMRANAEKLVAVAEASGETALGAFLSALDELKAQEAREGEAALEAVGVVRLMTVHKSKGLEFPVVLLADSSYKRGTFDQSAAGYDADGGWWAKVYDPAEAKLKPGFAARAAQKRAAAKEEAERRRLFYVAATRAADLLIVSGTVGFSDKAGLNATGWLGWLIKALDLTTLTPTDPQFADGLAETPIGAVALTLVPALADGATPAPPAATPLDDSLPAFAAMVRHPAEAEAPPLIGRLPWLRPNARTARDFSATQLADLGAALSAMPETTRALYRQRWQRSVGLRAPEAIPMVGAAQARMRARLVGEVVHRALQYGLEETNCDLRRLLGDYAWEAGIVEPAEASVLVEEALGLLTAVQASAVFGWVRQAEEAGRRVLREVPFTYQTAAEGGTRRRVHGQIDLMIEQEAGGWALVDFKTARLRSTTVRAHATRYLIQLGAYASAIEAQFGVTPNTWLYYIHHDALLECPEADWRGAVATLEEAIGAVFTPLDE